MMNHSRLFCISAVAGLWVLGGSEGAVFAQPRPADPGTYLVGDSLEPWEGGPAYYAQWKNGVPVDTSFFPISVWLQDPMNSTSATAYKNIGINMHIGLWQGPTEPQLAAVAALPTLTICEQNSVGLNATNRGVIKAWMHQDEPDNAQNGTQLPVPTQEVINEYTAMRGKDSTRPVYLNLGQGVASDAWYGRGDRTNHPEDYAEYARGADILSFDTYPMNVFPLPDSAAPWFRAFNNTVGQDIRFVGIGVSRLRSFVGERKPVWVWIECTNINGDARYALTPAQVQAEVWMAIVHGARGIGYFCHQFEPVFIEAGLLANAEMTSAVHSVNERVAQLAPVLNTQTVANGVSMALGDTSVTVEAMVKRRGGQTYLIAVATRPGTTTATFSLRGFTGNTPITVIGENRSLQASDGLFEDAFTNFDVHMYQVANPLTDVSPRPPAPLRFQLLQNFPNPFNPVTSIGYELPERSRVELKVFDALGRTVATLVDRIESAGYHVAAFDAGGIASGIYFYHLQTGGRGETRSLLLLK